MQTYWSTLIWRGKKLFNKKSIEIFENILKIQNILIKILILLTNDEYKIATKVILLSSYLRVAKLRWDFDLPAVQAPAHNTIVAKPSMMAGSNDRS